ncbi:MAG: nitroreductase family deazaflavin-dependent oxidoreductase [Acetobacteraceae bacterium]|nr:nitroreductase family deazaflavin-dependent oxidoreductase [Acetobacteraceae bacterium]
MPDSRAMQPAAIRAMGALNTWVYRLSGGRIMGRMPSGAPICLLTTTGRTSGQRRTAPLLYLADGDDFIVVGSQGGAPRHPGWFLNLEANPRAEVELGRRRVLVTARRLSEAERDRLWPRLVAMYPPYEDYRRRTARSIPVVRLSPRPPD